MLKLAGILVLLLGVLGELYSWNEGKRRRIKQLECYEAFLKHAIYGLETEKIHMQELLYQAIASRKETVDHANMAHTKTFHRDNELHDNTVEYDSVLALVLEDVLEQMRNHTYPSGAVLWREVWNSHRGEWNVDGANWTLILDTGKAFYGNNLKENLEYLRTLQGLLKEGIREEKNKWKEKQKVLTPVGILGGIMIVIILL